VRREQEHGEAGQRENAEFYGCRIAEARRINDYRLKGGAIFVCQEFAFGKLVQGLSERRIDKGFCHHKKRDTKQEASVNTKVAEQRETDKIAISSSLARRQQQKGHPSEQQ
jgi:uncharacterized protein YdaU (DUF1376 family)